MHFTLKIVTVLVFVVLFFRHNETNSEVQNSDFKVETITISSNNSKSESVGLISTLAGMLRNTFLDIEELLQKLLQNLTSNSTHEISRNTEKLLSKLTDRFVNALEVLSNEVVDVGNVLIGDIFNSIHSRLIQVKDEFKQLVQNIDGKFDRAVTHLNESLMNHTEEIDSWAANIKHELRSVNDTRLYNEGCQVIDEFIQRSTEQLQKCCSITIKPMRSLCRSVRSVLSEAFRVLAEVLDRIQVCLEDKNSYLEYMIPCINTAYDDLSELIEKAAQLRKKFSTMLPMKILYSRCCIAIVLVEVEQRQNMFENDLLKNKS